MHDMHMLFAVFEPSRCGDFVLAEPCRAATFVPLALCQVYVCPPLFTVSDVLDRPPQFECQ